MSEKQTFQDAYRYMVQARNFHYEQFNKWMNFFYVADGAVLYAYASIKPESIELKPLLSIFGLLISFCGYLSCKGYYYWIYNWSQQLNRLEAEMLRELRVYRLFSQETKDRGNILLPFRAANVSTSKIALLFFLSICLLWSYLAVYNFADIIGYSDLPIWALKFVLPPMLTIVLMVISYFSRSIIASRQQIPDDDLFIICEVESIEKRNSKSGDEN